MLLSLLLGFIVSLSRPAKVVSSLIKEVVCFLQTEHQESILLHPPGLSVSLARWSGWQDPHLPWFLPSTASPWGILLLQATSQLLMSSMTMWAGTSACLRCTKSRVFRLRAGLHSVLVHGCCRTPFRQMNRWRHQNRTWWFVVLIPFKSNILYDVWHSLLTWPVMEYKLYLSISIVCHFKLTNTTHKYCTFN